MTFSKRETKKEPKKSLVTVLLARNTKTVEDTLVLEKFSYDIPSVK